MPKTLTNAQSYVLFRQESDGTNTMAGVLREAADYLESLGPCDLLNVSGGLAVSEDNIRDCYYEIELYFDDAGDIARESEREPEALELEAVN